MLHQFAINQNQHFISDFSFIIIFSVKIYRYQKVHDIIAETKTDKAIH